MNEITLGTILLYCYAVVSTFGWEAHPYSNYKDLNCPAKTWQKVGCVDTKVPFVRGQLLVYWRWDIEWSTDRMPLFGSSFVCACAEAAKKANVKYFGTHFWGECFALNKDDVKRAPDGDCILADGSYKTHCDTNFNEIKGYECLAEKSYYMYKVIKVKEIVAGNWTSWGDWSACTKTCGNGTQNRTRACSNPKPENGGKFCVGNPTQTNSCMVKACSLPTTRYCEYEIVGKLKTPIQTERRLYEVPSLGTKYTIKFQFKLNNLPAGNATIFTTTTSGYESMIPSIHVMGERLVVIYESLNKHMPHLFRAYSVKKGKWYKVIIKQSSKNLSVKIKEMNGEKKKELLFSITHIAHVVYKKLQVMPHSKGRANGVIKKLSIKGSC